MKRWGWAWLVLILMVIGMFSETRAQRAVKFFESLRHTKGQFYGQPFVLLPWERQIVWDVYGTLKEDGTRQYRYVYIEIPKKNGKSELVAGAALYHTFADGEKNGEVYGCAADKKQASIVYKVAKDMIGLVPALAKRAKVTDSFKTITDRVSGTKYEVLSAEAYTKHGFNLSACVFDELHAQPDRGLWDVMTFEAGAARLQPIWWIITTAGEDPDRVSICWEQHEYAMKILAGDVIDPSWYVVIYSYEGDDIYNEKNWHKANPSLGTAKSIVSMREAAHTAKNKPANERLFRWLDLNQWITTKLTTWLPLELFETTNGKWSPLEMVGRECYMGLDLSSTTDLSALCLVFPPQGTQLEWRVMWECWIPSENMQERVKNDHVPYDLWAKGGWIIPTEGNVIDYTVIRSRILELATIYKVKELCADATFATMLIQELTQEGMIVIQIPQTFAVLTDPLNHTEILLKENKISHPNNPVAKWCFGNTSVAMNGQGLIKYVKEHRGKNLLRTKRIDLTAAWITAMARARFYKGSVDLSVEILKPDWGM